MSNKENKIFINTTIKTIEAEVKLLPKVLRRYQKGLIPKEDYLYIIDNIEILLDFLK